MKKNLKVITIILVITTMLTIGVNAISSTNTYKKYQLASLAKIHGATMIEVGDDSVTYLLGTNYRQVFEGGYSYQIKELSGK